MNPAKIVYLPPGGPSVWSLMREVVPPTLTLAFPDAKNRAEVLSELADAAFVITVNLDATLIAAAPHLRLIQLAGVGFDGVDLAAARRRRIPVAQTVAGTIHGVAEHTVLMILALYKHLLAADASVRRGEWLVWQLRPMSNTLYGKKVGILGLGRIGGEVARRCRAFSTEIGYADAVRAAPELESELGARRMTRDELVAWADVVSLHLPLSEATRGVIGDKELRLMKRTSILINTGRGGLVDEEALAQALEERRIAGAGLDVFAKEPPPEKHRLLTLPNTILSPHIATGTRESVIEKTRAASDNFARILRGEPPLDVINPEVLSR